MVATELTELWGQPVRLMMGTPLTTSLHAPGAGGVGVGRGPAAPGGAGAHSDDGCRIAGDLLDNIQRRAPADAAVDAIVLGGDGALDDEQVLSFAFVDGFFQQGFGLVTGGGHDGFVVVQGDGLQHDLGQCGV